MNMWKFFRCILYKTKKRLRYCNPRSISSRFYFFRNKKKNIFAPEKVSIMNYDIKDKMEWLIVFIHEFGKRHQLTMKQAFNYLSRFKGIEFLDQHYDYVHTQSFATLVADMTEYCKRKGGALV